LPVYCLYNGLRIVPDLERLELTVNSRLWTISLQRHLKYDASL